ncbi:ATP-binding cassette domain-containing protein, partial [Mesorhizobium sp. M00.F.Ca.ET.186.01.1.1]
MLKISYVNKVFNAGTVNEKIALRNVNLHVKRGEFITVIGSNGAGKSTMMNMISGGLFPDSGTITIDGQDVTRLGEHQRAELIGRVFQDPMAGTAPNMTIEENLAIALGRGRRRTLGFGVNNHKRELFREQLKQLDQGLENRLKTKVGFLSGGQRQRAWIAMTLAQGTDTILLDEPTTYLDMSHQIEILDLLYELNETEQRTIVMVLHDLNLACRYAHHIVAVHNQTVVAEGAPEDILTTDLVRTVFDMDC